MTKLSVNINKIAVVRNSRGGNNPNLIQVAKDCEQFGAEGITVHPRPDERHIRYEDVLQLKEIVTTELNVEGNPEGKFIKLIEETKPDQVTLVPDPPNAITSNAGWDTIKNQSFLQEMVSHFKSLGCRVSIFLDPTIKLVEAAAKTGADRVELYTESYALNYDINKEAAIKEYVETAQLINEAGLGLNAGHDLDLNNLSYFQQNVPNLLEVSIGHALICDALYMGLETTIKHYLNRLGK